MLIDKEMTNSNVTKELRKSSENVTNKKCEKRKENALNMKYLQLASQREPWSEIKKNTGS